MSNFDFLFLINIFNLFKFCIKLIFSQKYQIITVLNKLNSTTQKIQRKSVLNLNLLINQYELTLQNLINISKEFCFSSSEEMTTSRLFWIYQPLVDKNLVEILSEGNPNIWSLKFKSTFVSNHFFEFPFFKLFLSF